MKDRRKRAKAGHLAPTRTRRFGGLRRSVAPAVSIGVLCVLGVLTWRQVGVWHDTRTLWEYTIAVTPGSSVAHYNYGNLLLEHLGFDRASIEYLHRKSLPPATTVPTTRDTAGHNVVCLLL